jgi:hypothetical protein
MRGAIQKLVLYFSRHITPEHIEALKSSIGHNIKIIQIKHRISSVNEIYKRVVEYDADEVVAVLPKWMYVQYLSLHDGVVLPKPIRIVTKKDRHGDLIFSNFERVVAFDLITTKV